MIIETIVYLDGDTQLEGYLAYNETNSPQPLVLIAHDWSEQRELSVSPPKE